MNEGQPDAKARVENSVVCHSIVEDGGKQVFVYPTQDARLTDPNHIADEPYVMVGRMQGHTYETFH